MNQIDVQIRRASAGDARAIADIYNEAVLHSTTTFDTEPHTEEERVTWLRSHGDRHPVFVAVGDDQVVGWASLSEWSSQPGYAQTVEASLYITEKWRRHGIGRALTEHLVNEARQLGMHTIIARVAEGNDACSNLIVSLGFVLVGTLREVGMKFGRRLDVHVFQLML